MRHLLTAGVCVIVVAACAGPSGPATTQSGSNGESTRHVTVLVHDSFALPDDVIAQFEQDSSLDVDFVPAGDAGTLATHIALTAGAPLGDAVYGVDNTFASRVLDAGAIAAYVPPNADTELALADALTAIDFSDVCFNIDLAAYGEDAPRTLTDLTAERFAGQVSVPNPTTSSPGLALLLATYVEFGDDWEDYWRTLRDNGLKVSASWSDSYFVDFSAPNYGGSYPIVISYASSPPAEVIDGAPTTAALLDTCFRQVEYAGVLEGAAEPEGARAVVEWLASDAVQSALPEAMYVYPVSTTATVPADWLKYAPAAPSPLSLSPDEIDAHRDQLLRTWTEIVINGK